MTRERRDPALRRPARPSRAVPFHRRASIAALALLAAALFPGNALADAVFRKPLECPPGARVTVDHNDTWCQAVPCVVDADCAASKSSGWDKPTVPMVCREQPLCIEERHLSSVSGWSYGRPIVHDIASSTCGGSETCDPAAACVRGRRCVPAPAVVPRACACSMPGGPSPVGAGAAAVLAALGLWRRASRARRRLQRQPGHDGTRGAL